MNVRFSLARVRVGRCISAWVLLLGWLSLVQDAQAGSRLQFIDYAQLPGDRLEFVLRLDGPVANPRDFQTENPDRIVLDLPGVTNGLDKRNLSVERAGVRTVQIVEAGGRTRVVFNLANMQPYTLKADGQRIVMTLQGRNGARPEPTAPLSTISRRSMPYPDMNITRELGNVDFRRGEGGEGRVLVTLGDPKALVDIRREGSKVIIRLPEAILPSRLARRLDVIDFATPVHYIEAMADSGGARIVVTPVSDRYEFSSYQSGGLLAVEFRTISPQDLDAVERKKQITYSGNRLTLNFQDISVRSVLQILADFTNVNIVASDTVAGNVTLRLQDVPWDQALDLVLKSKGLGKRQEGNIIRVAPLEELNKMEQDELEARQVVEELEPLRTEIIQVNYTKAEELKKILVGASSKTDKAVMETNPISGQRTTARTTAVDEGQTLLSSRGNVTTDPRTNQLIIHETSRNLERIRNLIRELDKPVRQVLVESRIVIATNEFTRELGARLSLNRAGTVNKQANTYGRDTVENVNYAVTPPSDISNVSGDALVDLAATAASVSGGYFGVTFLKVGEYLLDLELSAAQIDGRTEIISTPKVVTTDGAEAYILQGEQIPYSQNNALGASNTQFKDAVLELKVTPHITADQNILMDLSVKKDAPGARQYSNGNVGIEKREILTTAQVSNGETMVLGGVFEGDQADKTDKVPFLGDLPGVGFMFRRTLTQDKKKELLIFITPKIVGSALVQR
ncbi:MAG: type IV pilus secretin PilQ [Methylococcus sp.]